MNSEIPSNLVLKKVSPKIWLPALTIAWGIVTMCLGFVRNYAGFMGVRALLGVTEGGLLPGMVSHRFEPDQYLKLTTLERFCTCPVCIRVVRWLFASVSFTPPLLSVVHLEVSISPLLLEF